MSVAIGIPIPACVVVPRSGKNESAQAARFADAAKSAAGVLKFDSSHAHKARV